MWDARDDRRRNLPLARVDVKSLPNNPRRLTAVFNGLDPAKDQLRVGLADGEGTHIICIGACGNRVDVFALPNQSTQFKPSRKGFHAALPLVSAAIVGDSAHWM